MGTKEIINYLEKKKIDFNIIEHKEVYLSKDLAKVTKSLDKEIAKVLLLRADRGRFIMAVLPGNLAAKIKKIKSYLGAKKLELATEKEMRQKTGLKPGTAPALGNYLKIKMFVDGQKEKNKNIIFSSGVYTKSIKMKVIDWLNLEKPEIIDFSVKPSVKRKSKNNKSKNNKNIKKLPKSKNILKVKKVSKSVPSKTKRKPVKKINTSSKKRLTPSLKKLVRSKAKIKLVKTKSKKKPKPIVKSKRR